MILTPNVTLTPFPAHGKHQQQPLAVHCHIIAFHRTRVAVTPILLLLTRPPSLRVCRPQCEASAFASKCPVASRRVIDAVALECYPDATDVRSPHRTDQLPQGMSELLHTSVDTGLKGRNFSTAAVLTTVPPESAMRHGQPGRAVRLFRAPLLCTYSQTCAGVETFYVARTLATTCARGEPTARLVLV